ncbi:MAG: restriction endonuclease subunit S [Bacteroidetes bacterium]|nr:restriction endonuclease subunit S [Bacteroidota bacterium]
MKNLTIARYPAYKDSGTDWLGEIPSHWTLKKAKYLWKEKIDLSETGNELLLSVSQYLGVNNRENESRSESLIGYKKVRENDLVINIMLAWLGGLGISELSGVVSPAYAVYELRLKCNTKFLHYLYRTDKYLDEFARKSKGVVPSRWRMYTDDFGQVDTLIPPLEEQKAIADFLDRKTLLIDKAIGIKEEQIRLLKERRQILIHNAVTKGLNHGFDGLKDSTDSKSKNPAPSGSSTKSGQTVSSPKSVSSVSSEKSVIQTGMKDSGIEWIGEIPEHWEVKRLASFGKFSKGGGISRSELTEDGLPAILYGDIYTKYDFTVKTVIHKVSSTTALNAKEVLKNTLLFTGSGETAEDIAKCVVYLGEEPVYVGGDVIIYEQNENDTLFLSYVLNSNGAKFEKARHSKGEIIVHTYASKLKDIFIPIPPKSEQLEISQYIETNSQNIADAITLKEQEIEKLKEYKATLINSAVTGKIKVSQNA